MLFNKREKSKEKFVKAYEEYQKAVKELLKETGWNFKLNQTITTKPEDEKEREELVKQLKEIESKYNTK